MKRGSGASTVSVIAIAACLALAGCSSDGWDFGSSGPMFGNPLDRPGAYWTINCMEWRGPDRKQLCERTAEALGKTFGVDAKEVFTRHDETRSRLYYGKYWRTGDKRSGQFDRPRKMLRDVKLIKDLAVDGNRYFVESRLMPYPTADVGNPEWQLRRNPGFYTLRIAIFFPEPGFEDFKQAAADYCEELRKLGHEAYYRHGDFTSEVFVGSLSRDALIQRRISGVMAAVPGPEAVALQRNPLFRYELHNGKTLAPKGGGQQLARASRVVPVHDDSQDDEFEYR